jgi:hypothetical protein
MHSVRFVGVTNHSLIALVAFGVANAAVLGGQVNFESPPWPAAGQTYGGGIANAGNVIRTQEGIDVSVETFRTGTFEDLNVATLHGPGTDSFATKHVFFDNINFGFDLTSIAPINHVTIDYHEFGGVNNFSVNGGPIIELSPQSGGMLSLANHPLLPAGITATVDADSIHLSGIISNFLIGGQELAVDNIVAVPEPTCLVLLAAGLGAGLLRRRR